MTKREPSVIRFVLVILLVAALGAVYTGNAQSSTLTQIAKTQDGQISVHLPQGWVERDTSSNLYSSVLAFGDSATTLQAAVDSLTQAQTTVLPGMNGVIAIVQPQLVGSVDPNTEIMTLFNSMISSVQQGNGQILQQQTATLGNGGYDAVIGIAVTPSIQAEGLFGAFTDGTNVALFTMGATPTGAFDANSQMFIDMMNSIRVPAEAASSAPPPAAPTPKGGAAPVQPNPPGQGGVTASPAGMFSVRLPDGYVSQPVTVQNFADTIAFGSDQNAMQGAIDQFVTGLGTSTISGVGGLVGVVQTGGAPPGGFVTQLMQALLGTIQSTTNPVVQQPEAHTFAGQYEGLLATTQSDVLAVMHTDTELLVALVRTDNPTANASVINDIVESIRIPAESSQQQTVPVTLVAPPPTQAVPPTEAAPPSTETSIIGNSHVTLTIPGGWTVLDIASGDTEVFAFGDSNDAAQSRLYSAKPDLATPTPTTGLGGLVILYPMSQFNIDPNHPDLMSLMTRVLQQLVGQGYVPEQGPEPVEGTSGGLYIQISGTERGYLALIPLGDQIAYVTATGTQSTFEANQSALLAIIHSVKLPALNGLGGLGGLGGAQPQATPEATELPTEAATAAPTPPGLGGL